MPEASDYCECSVTITTAMAHLDLKDPKRREADDAALQAFWRAEAAMGFPVREDAQQNQRRLMAMSGVVATQGHKLTTAGAKRAAAAARAQTQASTAKAAAAAPPPTKDGKLVKGAQGPELRQ